MELNEYQAPETTEVHIRHPIKGPLYEGDKPVTITVYGPASDVYAESMRVYRKRLLKHGGKINKIPMDVIDAADNERLATLTESVSGLTLDGDKITPKNVRKLYDDNRFGWIKEQVLEKLSGWEDFLS